MRKRARPGERSSKRSYRRQGSKPWHVMIYLTRFERDWILNRARKLAPLTQIGRPRTATILTSMIRQGIERARAGG